MVAIVAISITNTYSQCSLNRSDQFTASFYSSLQFSKGFELRPEFDDWYLAFQAEQFLKGSDKFFNWGFSVGLIKYVPRTSIKWFGGIRVGFMHVNGPKKPAFGLETESTYPLSENVDLGIRGAYDVYMDSPSMQEPNSESLLRPFVKLIYRF